MNALVGQAIKEDEDFYNTGIFAAKEAGQEDSDVDFNSAEVSSDARRDSFDSDFSQEENEPQTGEPDQAGGKKAAAKDQDSEFDSEAERDALKDDKKKILGQGPIKKQPKLKQPVKPTDEQNN